MSNRKLRTFLCHASQDKSIVRELYNQLFSEGWIDPWLDEEKIYPGQDWDMEIEKAVETADVVIVCLSKNSVDKEGYIQKEIKKVLDISDQKPEGIIFIIPLRLTECNVPRRLHKWQYIDYFPTESQEKSFNRLLTSLSFRAASLEIPTYNLPDKFTPTGCRIYTYYGMEFVKVSKGIFLMGSDENDKNAFNNEKPQNEVNIPYDYWIGRFPVTLEQYILYSLEIRKNKIDETDKRNLYPVSELSWEEALGYCRWLNNKIKRKPSDGFVARLPTEAEWEKSARGTDGRIYPWGNNFTTNKCNTSESGINKITPVDMFSPAGDSPYGCADISGNVREWTRTILRPYPYKLDELDVSGRRVSRGGSFIANATVARCAHRIDIFMKAGFRVVLAPLLKTNSYDLM